MSGSLGCGLCGILENPRGDMARPPVGARWIWLLFDSILVQGVFEVGIGTGIESELNVVIEVLFETARIVLRADIDLGKSLLSVIE